MPCDNHKNEKLFYQALIDLFVGAKIEGESGYINLMKIKSSYFLNGVFPKLQEEINLAVRPFGEDFREELFDKLYTFFQRYFSESGSIYFRHTAVHQNVYEKVYTDERDVVLFWKTHMLYYVKTDRIFNSMKIEVDGVKFYFDASKMTLKKANEKRETIYAFRKIDGLGQLVFEVAYSERGRKTKADEILRAVKNAGIDLNDETLNKACRTFEKQSEVDFFINKDARGFLREQFDLWMYQYLFKGENIWSETRLAQLQTIKRIAFEVIDFIAQFEDELVKVWNKPKFVRNSHYVITLDKLNEAILKKVFEHANFEKQVEEWRELGMLEDNFRVEMLSEKDLTGTPAFPKYQFLPIDTKYFPDLELDILSLFENLDDALDGWLIHSENYQALNTLSSKYKNRFESIYIDPPYNTDASSIIYKNNYKNSSWISLMENRCQLAKDLLVNTGIICLAIDDEEAPELRLILDEIFPKQVGIACVRSNPAGRKTKGKFAPAHEYAMFYGRSESSIPAPPTKSEKSLNRFPKVDASGRFSWANFIRSGSNDKREDRPKLFYPIFVDSNNEIRIPKMEWHESRREYILLEQPKQNEVVIYPIVNKGETKIEKNWQRGHSRVKKELPIGEYRVRKNHNGSINIDFKTRMDEHSLPITWWDNKKYASANYGASELKDLFGERDFDFPKATQLIIDCLKTSGMLDDSTIALDYFAGSGTTAHAVMNLNREDGGKRKYILVEMGDHFNTVILPRVKKVAFSSKWKDGKANGGQGMSHFVKCYDLEQYEETLQKAQYGDSNLLDNPYETPFESYVFLKDEKMLAAMEVDANHNRVEVHPERIYPDIDLAETLSQRRGKWIKRVTAETVELEDGEVLSLTKPDWETLKPLIWW